MLVISRLDVNIIRAVAHWQAEPPGPQHTLPPAYSCRIRSAYARLTGKVSLRSFKRCQNRPVDLVQQHGTKPLQSRPSNAQLSIREHDETARERIEAFVPNDVTDAAHDRVGAGFA